MSATPNLTRRSRWTWRPRFSLRTLLLASVFSGSAILLWQHNEPWQVRMTIHEQLPLDFAGYGDHDAYIYTLSNASENQNDPNYQYIFKTYDLTTGKNLITIKGPVGQQVNVFDYGRIIRLHTSINGRDGSPSEEHDQLWRADTGERLQIPGFDPQKVRVSFMSSQQTFAMLDEPGNPTWLVRLPSFEKIRQVLDGSFAIHGFSPDEKWFATSKETKGSRMMNIMSTDPSVPTISVLATGTSIQENVHFSPDGQFIAINDDDLQTLNVYKIQSGQLFHRYAGEFAAFSDDMQYIATGYRPIRDPVTHSMPGAWVSISIWPLTPLAEQHKSTRIETNVRIVRGRVLCGHYFSIADVRTGAEIISAPGYNGIFSDDGNFACYYSEYERVLCTTDGVPLHRFRKPDDSPIHLIIEFAREHSECIVFDYESPYGETDGSTQSIRPHDVQIWSRRRPEFWYGYAWLWEFWLCVALASALVWSILQPIARSRSTTPFNVFRNSSH